MRSPPNPSPTHSQPSLGSLPQSQAGPRSALRGSAGTTPPWAAETGSPGGWTCVEGCGVPAARPPPLPTPSGGLRTAPQQLQGERSSGDWAARLRSLAFQDSPPPQRSGRAAGGRGREIRSHNIGLRPSPPQTFRRGWGSRGQFGGLEKIAGVDRIVRGTPPPGTLSPIPHGQSVPPDPGAAGDASPAREPPRSSPRGAQGGARADSCPRRRPSLRPQTLSLARAASPARVWGQSGGPGEPLGSGSVQPRPHSPLLRCLNLWAPPSRSAPTTVRLFPRAAARPPARACPPCSAAPLPPPLGPARLGAPGLGLPAPPRRAPALSPPLPRLSATSPLTSGGVGAVVGGRGRDAKARPGGGCDPHASLFPAWGLGPPPFPVPGRPAPSSRDLRHRAGRWGGGGTSGPSKAGVGLTRFFRSVPQSQPCWLGSPVREGV